MYKKSFRSSSRPKSSREWTGASMGITGLVNAVAPGWIISPPSAIASYESPTLIRLLVAINARSVASASIEFAGFGIYVATGDEDDTGFPSFNWDPADDPNSDWAYRWMLPIPAGFPSTVWGNGGADITIDVRTKRKIPRGAGLAFVFQAQGTTVDFAADVRALILSG